MLADLSRQSKTLLRFLARRWVGEIPPGERTRKHYVLRALEKAIQSGPVERVLDAGSGDGVYSFWLGRRLQNGHVDGFDTDRERVEGCQNICQRYGVTNVEFRVADITTLEAAAEYDLITCTDVLEHLPEDRKQVELFFRALKAGGATGVACTDRYSYSPAREESPSGPEPRT